MEAGSQMTLWDHQEAGVSKIIKAIDEYGGGAFFWGMGSGKSVGALEVMRRLNARRVLIVGPINTLMDGVDSRGRELNVWRRDVPLVFGGPHVPVTLLSGTTAQKAAQVATVSDGVYCVNWESFWREPLFGAIKKAGFDLVIADEVHRGKSPTGKASRALATLAATGVARLGLSGTPLPHDPLDAWAIYRFIAPSIFPRTLTQMRARYTRPAARNEWRDPDILITSRGRGILDRWKLRDLDDLQQRMYLAAHRVRTDDVLTLPDFEDVEIPVELEPGARRVYGQMQADLIADLRTGVVTASNAMVRLLRLQQLTGGWMETDEGDAVEVSTAKRDALAEWLRDVGDEPVVVFCRFRTDLDNVHRAAEAAGLRSGELSGRRRELAEWGAGETQVLAAQVQAAREGIDLTRARLNVFYSLDFSLAAYEQARARSRRPGQSRAVQYVHLITRSSVDEHLYRVLDSRGDVISGVIDGLRS